MRTSRQIRHRTPTQPYVSETATSLVCFHYFGLVFVTNGFLVGALLFTQKVWNKIFSRLAKHIGDKAMIRICLLPHNPESAHLMIYISFFLGACPNAGAYDWKRLNDFDRTKFRKRIKCILQMVQIKRMIDRPND